MKSSLQYWIIPMMSLVIIVGILAFVLEYKINTLAPNIMMEFEEIKQMSCSEIKSKNALNMYWSKDNGAFGHDKVDNCTAAELTVKKAQKQRLAKLLADPNSFEFLSQDLKKYQKLYNSHQELYEFHASESEILKSNVTDFTNKINQIKSQLAKEYGVN